MVVMGTSEHLVSLTNCSVFHTPFALILLSLCRSLEIAFPDLIKASPYYEPGAPRDKKPIEQEHLNMAKGFPMYGTGVELKLKWCERIPPTCRSRQGRPALRPHLYISFTHT